MQTVIPPLDDPAFQPNELFQGILQTDETLQLKLLS